ncbi:MAG TPA: DinB family protein [Puia sp.]|jgi:hypothetical protein|nr:DinB family protein [Puia sp.]
MKKLLLAAILFGGLLLTAFRVAPGTLTPDERKYAVDYFLKTKARLTKDLKGLSEAQLNWKADTSRWSIYQCTEHIALAENVIFQWIQMTEHQPAAPEKRSEVKLTTEKLVSMTIDRSHKFQAPEMLRPETKFPSTEAALNAYTLRRDSTIAYLQTTQDDLKDHFLAHPLFGTMDLYQGLVFLAAHSERHTLQIEEVMADPNFPKH